MSSPFDRVPINARKARENNNSAPRDIGFCALAGGWSPERTAALVRHY
jgi:hypothetical protein